MVVDAVVINAGSRSPGAAGCICAAEPRKLGEQSIMHAPVLVASL